MTRDELLKLLDCSIATRPPSTTRTGPIELHNLFERRELFSLLTIQREAVHPVAAAPAAAVDALPVTELPATGGTASAPTPQPPSSEPIVGYKPSRELYAGKRPRNEIAHISYLLNTAVPRLWR